MGRRFAIGDVHGCYRTLNKLLGNEIRVSAGDSVYLTGDLIDRGPRVRDVIDYLFHLKSGGIKVYCVKGNHEEMFLRALDDKSFLPHWFRNGAESTLKSFDIPEDIIQQHESLKLIPENYLEFIQSLPLYYELQDYIIVHAGLNFSEENIYSDTYSMIWTRRTDYDPTKAENRTVIHGHTPLPAAVISRMVRDPENKVLNIDGGCVYSEYPGYAMLVALDLDTRKLYTQENID